VGRLRPGKRVRRALPRQQGRDGVRIPKLEDVLREAEQICSASSRSLPNLDVDDFGGSVPRLVKAARCRVWSPRYQDLETSEVALAQELG
jgi:hypothetical protein